MLLVGFCGCELLVKDKLIESGVSAFFNWVVCSDSLSGGGVNWVL
jgi:hypothetical protein